MPKSVGKSAKTGPVDLSPSTKLERKPRLEPNFPFWYVALPTGWIVNNAATALIPSLRQFAAEPGCNDVSHNKSGTNADGMQTRIRRMGGKVLEDTKQYLQAVDCEDGLAYISMFETAQPGSKRTVPDIKARDKWLASIAKDCPQPTPDFLRAKLDGVDKDIDRLERDAQTSHTKARLTRLAKERKVWAAALDKAEGIDAPEASA